MRPNSRKRIAILVALALVALIAGGLWQVRDQLRFWWLFESIGTNAQRYPEFRHRQTGIVMVRLPGGTFWMGAQSEDPEGRNYDPDAEEDEGPVHEVTLSPFLIAKYEVTQGQWLGVMGENPSSFQPNQEGASRLPPELLENEAWLKVPVEQVSWEGIQKFEEATRLTLPSGAQWEYACRAGASTPFFFGAVDDCDRSSCDPCPEADALMWWCGNSDGRTHKVGTKQANGFGLHDMHGNLGEWCEDVWDSGSLIRVVRGGGWSSDAKSCRSAIRYGFDPSFRSHFIGVRLAYWPLPSGL